MTIKFALVGHSRVGKDKVAEMIQKFSVPYIHRIAFGDRLKDELFKLFPNLPKEPKPRKAYETFGQMGRLIQEDIWIEKLAHTVEVCKDLDIEHFVLTDCRQMNESIWLKEQGYKLIRVNATDQVRKERCGNEEFLKVGESEKELHLIECDYDIHNNGSLRGLMTQVAKILKQEGVETWLSN